ncbi:MAG: protein jag [Actinomycetota bacterium]
MSESRSSESRDDAEDLLLAGPEPVGIPDGEALGRLEEVYLQGKASDSDPNRTPAEGQADAEEPLEAAREEVLDFLDGLLEAMEVDGEVMAEIEGDGIQASVNGQEAGLLIGRRGQTLEAIQEVLRNAVQRQVRARVRIGLDVEGYQSRRRAVLQERAREMAERAMGEGEVEFEPMSAFERKMIHDAVGEIEGVTSFSEGEEPYRRVVISRGEPFEED